MNSRALRDILGIGAIVLGLGAMFLIAHQGASSSGQAASDSGASSAQESDEGSADNQTASTPFQLGAVASAPLAPDFTLTATDGRSVTLSQAVKNGPVLLDFWATWCGPCRYELPELSQVYDQYHARGVQIYAINTDTDLAGLKQFFRSAHPDCPVLIDPGQGVASQYQVTALPSLFLIDSKMRIRSEVEGLDLNTKQDLGRSLDQLLAGA